MNNCEEEIPMKRTRRRVAKNAIVLSSDEEEDIKPTIKKRKTTSKDDDFEPEATTSKRIKKDAAPKAAKRVKKEVQDKPKTERKPRKTAKKQTKDEDLQDKSVKKESKTRKNVKIEATEEGIDKENLDVKVEMEVDSIKAENTIKKECLPVKQNVAFKQESTSSKFTSNNNASLWVDYQLLAEMQCIDLYHARKLVELFDEGSTVPFIARYRKDLTGNMEPDQVREAKECYEKINDIKEKQEKVIKSLEKVEKLTPDLASAITCSKTLEEIDHLYAPFKPGAKRSLAERAKAAGLEDPAMNILNDIEPVDLIEYVDEENIEIESVESVQKGIVSILAHKIATDTDLLNFLREESKKYPSYIETKKAVKRATTKETKEKPQEVVDELKFETYFEFSQNTRFLKPHQILAINRGEHFKVLSVKFNIHDGIQTKFQDRCFRTWLSNRENPERVEVIREAVELAYSKTLQPLLIKEIRSELKTRAEKAACGVFSSNLKQLLLAAPLKGCPILAIDPGFHNGCKVALISPNGAVIGHAVIYPNASKKSYRDEDIVKRMIVENRCETIALGNGTACRETETWLNDLIKRNVFQPLDVKYTIISENGVSIYSCSPEAKKEFDSLDPVIISAISLARRLQDPLAELVKVEPKHLGVGMYQHDVPKKQLEEALNEVVSECVSFTGVDLNTASQCLLRRIAGLTDKRATAIIDHRDSNGSFTCRKDLLAVKGIGPKVFEQCAGFLRVGPFNKEEEAMFYRNPKANPLDRTDIHPESYDLAKNIMDTLKLNAKDIGTNSFTSFVSQWGKMRLNDLVNDLKKAEQTISQVLDALSKPLNYDFRNEISKKPLFRKSLTNLNDLKQGMTLTGCIRNVCDFGSFVDIGVGANGLIHNSKMNGLQLNIGDTVDVEIINLDIARKRIGLLALKKL